MADSDKISDLGYALLGLLSFQPNTGYGLRKIFATTPMGSYSSSPGAIYPALARLEQQSLIAGQVDKSKSKRPKQVFRVTARGTRALKKWLREPVTEHELIWNNDMLHLRFSFLDLLGDLEVSERFVIAVRDLTESQVIDVREFVDSVQESMPLHGRMALERGLAIQQTTLEWCSSALKNIATEKRSHK